MTKAQADKTASANGNGTVTPINKRDLILNYQDMETQDIVCPEWGGVTVKIRTLSAAERDMLEAPAVESAAAGSTPQFHNFRARVVVIAALNDDGSKMFTEADIDTLGTKHAGAVSRIADAVIRLSRFSDEDIAELGKGIAATIGSASGSS
jgi:hypothetical protein